MTQNKEKSVATELEWRENLPVSVKYDDPYFSIANGRAETNHVFIEGNSLSDRFKTASNFKVAELGFGTGLNFLETWNVWEHQKPIGQVLEFISFEQFPLEKEQIERALSSWPELKEKAEQFAVAWKPTNSQFQHTFDGSIHLTVHIGDANRILPSLDLQANAWFLDGFSPAKNPELWNENLMQAVYDSTGKNGTFATYTAAGWIRENLAKAGFEVAKTKGFGNKRHMTTGIRAN